MSEKLSPSEEQAIKEEAGRIAKGVAMLDVEMVDISWLKPYEKNSKIHDKAHINRLAANIKHEGLQESLLVEEDGTIVAGHGRWESCKQLEWSEIPVRIMRGYTKAQCMLHRVSSNLTVSNKYDSIKQSEELSEIQALYKDSDISVEDLAAMSGYSERDIEVLSEEIAGDINLDDLNLDDINEPEKPKKAEEPEEEDEPAPVKTTKLSALFGFDNVNPETARAMRKFLAISEIDSEEGLNQFLTGYLSAAEEAEEHY